MPARPATIGSIRVGLSDPFLPGRIANEYCSKRERILRHSTDPCAVSGGLFRTLPRASSATGSFFIRCSQYCPRRLRCTVATITLLRRYRNKKGRYGLSLVGISKLTIGDPFHTVSDSNSFPSKAQLQVVECRPSCLPTRIPDCANYLIMESRGLVVASRRDELLLLVPPLLYKTAAVSYLQCMLVVHRMGRPVFFLPLS